MPPFIIKGKIKASIKGVGGVTVRVVKVPEGIQVGQATTLNTGDIGSYVFDPIDLESTQLSSKYKIRWEHPDYDPREMPLPDARPGSSTINVTHPIWSAPADPFGQYKNQLSKGPFYKNADAGFFLYDVLISDASSNTGLVTGAQVRQRLLAAPEKDTWKKTYDDKSHQLVKVDGDLRWKTDVPPDADSAYAFDLTENDRSEWDWLVWETEGNSDPKYQRGGKLRNLGLYKLDYDKLRKAGDTRWKPVHTDHTIGGGWVKVATLDSLDYSSHSLLIKTFLPCFNILSGKVVEPAERQVPAVVAPVAMSASSADRVNTLDIPPPQIVLPFNYDDNGGGSRALGRDLTQGVLSKVSAQRLAAELPRWSTASRSTIAAFSRAPVDLTPNAKPQAWELRPASEGQWKPQILGDPDERTLRAFQAEGDNSSVRYYSVKTGVQYVSKVNQLPNGKDLLEENSIHAMNRSNLIKATIKRLGGEAKFEGRYQVEILCILLQKNPDGDSFYENPANRSALSNAKDSSPEVMSKRHQIGQLTSSDEEANSDEIAKLDREIAEIRKPEEARIKDIKSGLGWDGIQIREISDAGINDIWFPALAIPSHGKAFAESWAAGQEWVQFWKSNFAVPLGRAKAEMLLYFGMQHMTSNSQNFLIAFDRSPGGATGKLKHVILRDIGDTLYNDHVFDILKGIDPSYADEWNHESGDPFGVTLASSLGSYTMPRMLRIGASIVFFFEPFVKADIEALPNCARTLSDWCVAHNNAFLVYMREKLGYRADWNSGPVAVDPGTVDSISKYCELIKQNDIRYKFVVNKVLSLNSTQIWSLIADFERQLSAVSDLAEAKRLVNAHEVMICAEVQSYLRSDRGKAALCDLHRSARSAASASAAMVTGPGCSMCGADSKGVTRGWHECEDCKKCYCQTCYLSLSGPTSASSPDLDGYRYCKGCAFNGTTKPL